jgi:hypothetical protein
MNEYDKYSSGFDDELPDNRKVMIRNVYMTLIVMVAATILIWFFFKSNSNYPS